MSDSPAPAQHTNRLIDETSPYLLQHARNPVDWYPWGPDALERARSEDRLILLSIGYSACHWCHVMERESFENGNIAALMNEHFVNVKVDREERPDLDDIYMAATLALNHGQGGWPMTVFLAPDLTPVFAGTYFPPDDAHGRPGFPTLLRSLAKAWEDDRDRLLDGGARLVEHLRARQAADTPLTVGVEELRLAVDQYAQDFDETFGGFGDAPKFPAAAGLGLLLRLHRRFDDERALAMVRRTLDAMARGGIYDHVGGGFARYATDRAWLVPHFEKMLYDNALLATVYLEAFQVTGDVPYRRVAAETLDYVLREMTDEAGGFYSATDADSEGEEGKFFVWTPDQIRDVLDPDDANLFCAVYDITDRGNWEGKSIPNTPRPLADVAKQFGLKEDALRQRVEAARARVYEARASRVPPGLDDKVLTAWNGMMMSALAAGARVLDAPRYLEAATRAADFVLGTMRTPNGALLRTYRKGKAHLNAYLEDYAFLAEGLLDLYESGGDVAYLRAAEECLERLLSDFLDDTSGAFFNTASDHETLLLRYRDGTDGATPAANAVAAMALVRASHHLDRAGFRTAAVAALRAYGQTMTKYPRAFAMSLHVVDLLLEGPVEVAVVGSRDAQDFRALRAEVGRHFLPNRTEAPFDPERDPEAASLPLLRGKTTVDGGAALYLCRQYACQAPVTTAADARALLQAVTGGGTATAIAGRLAGHATPEGTTRYAHRFAGRGVRELPGMDLQVAAVGFGAYRVTDDVPEHREALTRALASGINLIDTSTNYMDGGSERVVGSVLRDLTDGGDLARDEVVVVSKIGYVQGENYRIAQAREEGGDPFPEMVKIDEGLWHCIHPDFLADQLNRSQARLELDTLDVCLLHNPEYYLSHAAARGGATLAAARDEFYRRVRRAFEFFEERVAVGALRWYGVSSNTAVASEAAADATSLTTMLDIARAVAGGDHHFRVLQIPLNLFEAGAVSEPNNGTDGRLTVLQAAREAGIAVLANRPLNAFTGETVIRLADVAAAKEPEDFEEAVNAVAVLEDGFRATVAPSIPSGSADASPADFFRWGDQMRALRSRVQGVEAWSQLEMQISYSVAQVASALDAGLAGEDQRRWQEWRLRYFPALNRLLGVMREVAAYETQVRADAVRASLAPGLPAEYADAPLARIALWAVASTEGVSCVLNGMRTVEYVHDAVACLEWPGAADPGKLYEAVAGRET